MARSLSDRSPALPKAPGVKRSASLILLVASFLPSCDGQPPLDSHFRHCEQASPGALDHLRLSQEWAVGGAADTVQALNPPLVYPTPAPRSGLSFAQRPEAPVITLNADGSVRSRIGSAGSGPGEWLSYSTGGVAWYGDTLWVAQMQPPRIHAFSADGALLGTRQLDAELPEPVTLMYRLRNGSVVGSAVGRIQGGARRLVHWVGPSHPLDSIGVAQENFAYRIDLPGTAFAYGPRPVPDDLLTAPAPDGRSLVLVDRKAATTGDRAEFRIRRIAEDGGTLFERRVCYHPLAMPAEDRADTITRQAEMLADSRDDLPVAAAEQRVREALNLPAFWPPVDRVVVGTDGDIWLRREVRHGEAPWEVRDAEGELTGVVVLPAGELVLAVDGDVVWTRRLDEWDVPVIVRNRLLEDAPRTSP